MHPFFGLLNFRPSNFRRSGTQRIIFPCKKKFNFFILFRGWVDRRKYFDAENFQNIVEWISVAVQREMWQQSLDALGWQVKL